MVEIMRKISTGMIALALKIGPKILTVVVKFAKIGKFGLATVSMITYSYLFTWKFAIMIMVLLFVHEYGHIWAMKRCGLKTKGIYFIPFFGAAAVTEEMFKSRRDEAYIAIMGPIFGLVLSGVALVIYIVTKNALFGAAAGWMAMVNLFNLLPINPLDGGRMMKSIAFSINSTWGYRFLAVGLILSMVLTIWAGMVLFFLLLIVGIIEFIFEYLNRNENMVIKTSLKDIDQILENLDGDLPDKIRHSIDNVKGILSDKNTDPIVRINAIISIGENIDNQNSSIDYHTRMLSHIISPILKRFNHMPRMTAGGIVVTAIVYVVTIAVLWTLIWYASHIPEVEIARQFFMS